MNNIIKNLLFSASIALLVSGCGGHAEEKQQPTSNAFKVSVKEVALNSTAEKFEYSGTIEPENSVSVGFSVSGRITNVSVTEGQHIRAGQLLASIETSDYANALQNSAASLGQAQDTYNRMNELYLKKACQNGIMLTPKQLKNKPKPVLTQQKNTWPIPVWWHLLAVSLPAR